MRTDEDIADWSDRIESAIRATPGCCVGSARVYRELGSTQDAAARDRAPGSGIAVIASVQTAGRGSRGRRWEDGDGCTLPISLAFETEHAGPALAARAGLAALDACSAHAPGTDVRVKWPNDVIVRTKGGDRKLAGVLVERSSGVAVVGIGVNVLGTPPGRLTRSAATLESVGGHTDRCALAIELIRAMTRRLGDRDDAIRACWRERDAMIGTERSFVVDHETLHGLVVAVDPLDAITVRTTAGLRTLPVATTRTA